MDVDRPASSSGMFWDSATIFLEQVADAALERLNLYRVARQRSQSWRR